MPGYKPYSDCPGVGRCEILLRERKNFGIGDAVRTPHGKAIIISGVFHGVKWWSNLDDPAYNIPSLSSSAQLVTAMVNEYRAGGGGPVPGTPAEDFWNQRIVHLYCVHNQKRGTWVLTAGSVQLWVPSVWDRLLGR